MSTSPTIAGGNATLSRIADQQAATARAAAQTPSATGQTGTSRELLNQNFDMFLQLLTTQLRNQSPLDPMKSEQFAQQLTQFSAVEQQIKSNDLLSRLITTQNASNTTAVLGFLGSDITAATPRADLRAGQAQWSIATTNPGVATVSIRDAAGVRVAERTVALNAGTTSFTWDGRGADGLVRPDGAYQIVVEAKGADQQPLATTVQGRGRIQAVDLSGTEPVFSVAGGTVKLSEVVSVRPGT